MPNDATDRHRARLEALASAILEGPGVVPQATRAAAASNGDVPAPFSAYVDTIHRHAYQVTDATVASLAEAGADDDALFEVTVAAAYGAARTRLDAGLRALQAARGDA